MFIYPYKIESTSARNLAAALGAKRIKIENSTFRGHPSKIVINWGNTMTNEEIEKSTVLNKPDKVKIATNKLTFFQTVEGEVPIPDYTTDSQTALQWLREGEVVVSRYSLTGHSGKGVVIFETEESFLNYLEDNGPAPLYTKYIPKKEEYRLHIVGGELVYLQQKKRNVDVANPNWRVRNHAGGFIYASENVTLPSPQMQEDAVLAVQLCGLHFGAVDMIWNNHRNKGYVLEVNTAPGLEGRSIDKYAQIDWNRLARREEGLDAPAQQRQARVLNNSTFGPPGPNFVRLSTGAEEYWVDLDILPERG